jgi:predicted dehydrogenase
MTQKIRYAIIGFGEITKDYLAPEGFALDRSRFSPHTTCELVGITSIPATCQSQVEAMGVRWYPTQEAVLSDPEIDAVFIATPNATHAEIAKAALNAGKHVLLEKPMCHTVADAEEIIELARAKKLSLGINHNMVFNAYNIKAAEIVQSGVLGEIADAVFHMEIGLGLDPVRSKAWRFRPEERGGPIGDIASHCFYSMEFILGTRIESLAAVYTPKLSESAIEDGAFIRVVLANGLRASVRVSFVDSRGGERGILTNMGYEVYGTSGILRSFGTLCQKSGHAGELVKTRLEIDNFETVESIVPEKIVNSYAGVVLSHANSILTGQRSTGECALHNLRVCMAAYDSADNGGTLVQV